LVNVFPVLQLQEKEKQNRHKLSFYIPLETDAKKLITEMDTRLKLAGIKANLIWSIDEAIGVGLLDVIPASANKLHAIRFLMQQHGFIRENTVFAGDSGNDLDVLLSDIPSVLVANAGTEVRSQTATANTDAFYIAKGGYLGMNGNYSAGILEGVAHYLPDVDAWLREQN
jgi:hydroxymethylpyrimidine pyrophosphatase-like HAD family hydrolase